eukprot:TRINITY_DN40720_c0_g1_i5.p1 TRINITY_DN40720_c0_g1~~TRINITY_DN40720_c0_g1_i5.p1  ORF type:complete len:443 (+),score=52.91 TRINITY_DN40720_c0_g1_i5:98-1330(+)
MAVAVERLPLLGQRGLWQEALATANYLRQARLAVRDWQLAAALSACRRGKRWSCAFELFKDLRLANLQADTISCSAAASGPWPTVAAVLSAVGRMGIKANTIIYNAGINAYSRNAKSHGAEDATNRCALWADAVALYAFMQRYGVRASSRTMNTLVSASRSGHWAAAFSLVSYTNSLGVPVEDMCWNSAAAACDAGLAWAWSSWLLAAMHDTGLRRDRVAVGVAVTAAGERQQWRLAMHLLQCMSAHSIRASLAAYSAAAGACSWRSAMLLLFRALDVHSFTMNQVSYADLIRSSSRSGAWAASFSLLLELRKGRLEANTALFNSAVAACENEGGVWQWPLSCLTDIRIMAHAASALSFNIALSSCENGLQWQLATPLLLQMLTNTLRATVVTYSAAISVFEKGLQWSEQ